MLISAIVAVVILAAAIGYVAFRKYSVTRQEIAFGSPQNGVAAIYLDIREDTVRTIHIVYDDGTVSEVRRLRAAQPARKHAPYAGARRGAGAAVRRSL